MDALIIVSPDALESKASFSFLFSRGGSLWVCDECIAQLSIQGTQTISLIAMLLLLHDDSVVLHLLLKLNVTQRLFSVVTREREVVLKLKSECMLLLQGLCGWLFVCCCYSGPRRMNTSLQLRDDVATPLLAIRQLSTTSIWIGSVKILVLLWLFFLYMNIEISIVSTSEIFWKWLNFQRGISRDSCWIILECR